MTPRASCPHVRGGWDAHGGGARSAPQPVAGRSRRWATLGLTLILPALVAVPPVAVAQEQVEGNRYTNGRYGMQIDKPANWYFITAGTVIELARKVAGARPAPDADPVKTAGFAVIVSKVPILGRDFDPQVVVLVQETDAVPTDLVAACEKLRSGMTEPETVRAPQRVEIDGQPTVRLDFLGYVDGVAVRAGALCTFRNRRAYFAVAQALVTDFDGETAAFDAILQSFRVK